MNIKTVFFTLVILVFSNLNVSAEKLANHVEKDIKTDIKETIAHHLMDSHDFILTHDISFPLPVILYTDGNLDVFSSANFHHGTTPYTIDGRTYSLDHGHIVEANGLHPIDFSITKNVTFIMIVFLLMLFMFIRMAKSYKKSALPSGIGRLLEPIVLYIRDDIAIPNIGEKHYKKFMSYLLTVFFFIWIINLFGLTPLGVNVTNNIAVTLSLALITYVLTTVNANKSYWGHIFWMPGVPTPMKLILAPIELLGTIIKPFSLMIRLYANITAGHIVLMSILGLMFVFKGWIGSSLSFGLAFALSLLELLVAALQAYIFTMLSALYFGSAVEEHDDH
jgi:F-type H+-transporting ATPase subunit a